MRRGADRCCMAGERWLVCEMRCVGLPPMMMIRRVLVHLGMGSVPFKTGQIKCSVLYEPDWLGDNRTLFADGAFCRVESRPGAVG
jgi:hypothetical protein